LQAQISNIEETSSRLIYLRGLYSMGNSISAETCNIAFSFTFLKPFQFDNCTCFSYTKEAQFFSSFFFLFSFPWLAEHAVLVVGTSVITVVNQPTKQFTSNSGQIVAVESIDATRYLLGDALGCAPTCNSSLQQAFVLFSRFKFHFSILLVLLLFQPEPCIY
jgi:hypothetical protein